MDWIKGAFTPTAEQSDKVKARMKEVFYEVTELDKKESFTMVYGNYNDTSVGLMSKTHLFYNYIIGFNTSGKFIIISTDSDLKKASKPIYISAETAKKISSAYFGTLYQIEFNSGDDINFMVPAATGNLAVIMGGSHQIAIDQKEEAQAFKEFFNAHFGK